ncbi:MAG: F420-dependent methylenetetrahydromethanopterin dehydrogenase [Methanosarcinaceae archaeon]|nr:F420-dependent methylenetetrahydromethanopterin dehydrogenase [Methanosarcinaceae archaeon]
MVNIGFIKMGNLGMSQVINLIQDEIAAREGIKVRVFGTGAKMNPEEAAETESFKEFNADFVVMISPNAAAPGPSAARELWKDVPCIVISDGPTKKDARQALEDAGFGYIILPVDPLIGAKREFLDPVEMASFNSDALKVLSLCGVVRLIQEEFDKVTEQAASGKAGKELELPHIFAKPEKCVEYAGFSNPYAKAKALAALHMAEKVAQVNFPACFMLKDIEQVCLAAAAGHEIMGAAAGLATQAREIEKSNDTVFRQPHAKDGRLLKKVKLFEKPQ